MEFSGAGWKMDGKDFLKAAPYSRLLGSTVRIKQYELGGSAVFFIEGKSRFRFGLSAGYGVMPSVSYSSIYTHPPFLDYISEKISNETRYVPLDLYIKYKSRGGGFGFFAGGGADYLMARTTYDYYSYDPAYTPTQNAKKGEFTQSKAVPHAQAGCEWFISRRLSLNFGAKYLFSAALNNLRGKMTYNGVTDPEKYRMVMGYFPPPGEVYLISFDQASQPLGPGERLFRYDFSGLRGNFALRFYF